MIEVYTGQDGHAKKVWLSVYPKDTTEWRKLVLNRDHFDHNQGALTIRPCCRQSNMKI